jgi:pimeloyl-ACP methyl ester carboxylesterase
MNNVDQEAQGDGFKPYPTLEPYSRNVNQLFNFDSVNDHGHSPVLLIHGNGDEADTWRHVFEPLAGSFRVLALDLPGFGRSKPSSSGDLKSLAVAITELVAALNLQRVHLVGSSMGAVVAALFAVQHPSLTASLTMVGGANPSLGQVSASPAIQTMLEPGVGENYYNGLRTQGIDAAFATLEPYYANLQGMSRSDREFLRARVWARVCSDTQREAFFAALRSLFDADQPPIVGLEKFPSRFIWGQFDHIIPVQSAWKLQESLPNAKLEILPDAGHLVHQEQPEAFLGALVPFLRQVEAALQS